MVSVTINLATEREAELRLSYQVRGPGWQPSYRATLDANKSTVLIERQALVAQNSSEPGQRAADFVDGPARARHTRTTAAPLVAERREPAPRVRPAPAMAMAPAPAPTVASLSRSRNAAEEAMPTFDVSALDKGFATEFTVPQRITVPSAASA